MTDETSNITGVDRDSLVRAYLWMKSHETASRLAVIQSQHEAAAVGGSESDDGWLHEQELLGDARRAFTNELVRVAESSGTNIFTLESELGTLAKAEPLWFPLRGNQAGAEVLARWLSRSMYVIEQARPDDAARVGERVYVLPDGDGLVAEPFRGRSDS